jgi:hypothetical protein
LAPATISTSAPTTASRALANGAASSTNTTPGVSIATMARSLAKSLATSE